MPKRLGKKSLNAIIPVDNKSKSEQLFGTIYLKIYWNISTNFLGKCLLFDIIFEKDLIVTLQKC